jgi:acyl-CoA reductase-like NAD-dependent aldehyde dehydrogenase
MTVGLTRLQIPVPNPDCLVYTRREPVGVVAAITPWNDQVGVGGAERRYPRSVYRGVSWR